MQPFEGFTGKKYKSPIKSVRLPYHQTLLPLYPDHVTMRIITLEPSPILTYLVKSMWIVEEQEGQDIHIRSFPTGFPYLNVIQGNPFIIEGDKELLTTDCYLSGMAYHPFELRMHHIRRALTVQLHPQSLFALFKISAAELSEKRMPIHQLSATLHNQLVELINSTSSSEAVLKKVSQVLAGFLTEPFPDLRVSHAIKEIIQSKGAISVPDLARDVNVSTRRLQQLFKLQVGLSPKRYSKVIRLQYHTYKLLVDTPLQSIVPDGYYDQSHFIHDIKSQTGMLPKDFTTYIRAPERKPAYYSSNLYNSY